MGDPAAVAIRVDYDVVYEPSWDEMDVSEQMAVVKALRDLADQHMRFLKYYPEHRQQAYREKAARLLEIAKKRST